MFGSNRRMRACCLAVSLGAAVFLSGTGAIRAEVILQSVTESVLEGELLGGTSAGNHHQVAVGFNTGSSEFLFGSVMIWVQNFGEAGTYSLSGGIYADGADAPGLLYAPFSDIAVPENTATNALFQTVAPTTLEANTTYWILLDGPTAADRYAGWNYTKGGEPMGTLPVTYAGTRISLNSGSTWSDEVPDVNVYVDATTVPEPATWVLAGLGIVVIVRGAFRRREIA